MRHLQLRVAMCQGLLQAWRCWRGAKQTVVLVLPWGCEVGKDRAKLGLVHTLLVLTEIQGDCWGCAVDPLLVSPLGGCLLGTSICSLAVRAVRKGL